MDYRFLSKRTNTFIESLDEELVGWKTNFSVDATDNSFAFDFKVTDSFWNREITFKLNIRSWMISNFNVNEKVDFKEMIRISNSMAKILSELSKKFEESSDGKWEE